MGDGSLMGFPRSPVATDDHSIQLARWPPRKVTYQVRHQRTLAKLPCRGAVHLALRFSPSHLYSTSAFASSTTTVLRCDGDYTSLRTTPDPNILHTSPRQALPFPSIPSSWSRNSKSLCFARDGRTMTSRPPMGRQPPQRSLSSSTLQRPPPHRTLSQQFSSSSPTRRGNEGLVDLTFDGDTARHGPRVGTSRLRVEISKDSKASEIVDSPKPLSDATPTWRPSLPPRGRPQLHFDVPSVSNLSPRPAQEGGQNEVAIKPMPLPVRPGQHPPPSSEKSRPAPSNAAKKDARPKPYVLEVPTAAPHYPPNGA